MIATQPVLIRPTISQALRALASLDGDRAREVNAAGFSRIDGDLGHRLAAMPEEWMSPKQRYFAYQMLAKYRRQLSGMGIDYGAILAPPAPTEELQARHEAEKAARIEARRQGRRIALIGTSTIAFVFDYDEALVAEVKLALPVRWHKDARQWRMRIELDAIPAVRDFARRRGFVFSPNVEAELERVETEQTRRIEASSAAAADFRVNGLLRTLYPFQAAGVRYAVEAERCIIADEMGLGKTIQAIATAHHHDAYPVLCVVPASVKINWRREWEATVTDRRVVVLDGRKPDRRQLYDEYGERRADVVIVNYDLLAGWVDLLACYGFRAAIADEAHYLKSPKAQRTVAATQIVSGLKQRLRDGKPVRGKYDRVGEPITIRLALTGTPVLSRPAELAAILKWLDRLDEVGGYWAVVNCKDEVALNTKLRARCYVRREKRAVLPELPPIQRTRVTFPIDNRAEYKRVERDVIGWIYERAAQDEAFLATVAHLPEDARAKAIRDHQWSRASTAARAKELVAINALKSTAALGKLAGIKAWVEDFLETGEPLILFADHIAVQKAFVAAFPGCAAVLGEMGAEERTANVDRFQTDPDCRLIVCSLGAAREGLTLTRASNVAFVEMGWTPGAHDQAEARCYGRMSDLHGANAWYLIAEDTIDEWIEELIAEKRAIVDALTIGKEKGEPSDTGETSVAADVLERLKARGGKA